MNRNIVVLGIVAVVLVIAAAGLFVLRNGGEISALAQLDAAIAPYEGTYDNASYDAVGDRLTVDGLTLHDYVFDPDAEPLDIVAIGHLEAKGLARGSIDNALRNGQEQRILQELSANNLTFTEAGQIIHMDGLSLSEVVYVPLPDVADPSNPGAEDISLTRSQEMAQSLLSFHAAHIEVTGFSSPAEGPTGIRVNRIDLEDVSGGQVGSIVLEGFALWDHGQAGTVGDTIDMSGEFLEVSRLDGRIPLQRLLEGEEVNFERQSDVPTFAQLDVRDIRIEEESGSEQAVSFGSLMVRHDDYIGAMPTETTLSIEGFVVPINSEFIEAEQVQAVRDLGYDELVFNFAFRSDFDPTTRGFEITGLTLGVEDMIEMSLRLSFADIPFSEEMADMTANALLESGYITQVLEDGKMGRGELRVRDLGLLERTIDQGALRVGVSSEEFVAQVLASLATQRQAMASSTAAVQGLDAMATFVSEAGSISMTIAPDAPLPFSQMVVAAQINPILLVEMLNLEITAE